MIDASARIEELDIDLRNVEVVDVEEERKEMRQTVKAELRMKTVTHPAVAPPSLLGVFHLIAVECPIFNSYLMRK
jgi:hypothetical protein